VCDTLREATGARPSVDTRHPTLPLVLFLGPDHASLYVDTSGEALFKRGWRDARGGSQGVKGEAPLKETLAAAMLAAAGWQGRAEDGPLLDPCCGAGTIAIEAAQLACGIAPGLQRSFAFERQLPFAAAARGLAAPEGARPAPRVHAPAVPVYAGDVSFRMTDFATRNAERAGVAHAIEFKTADALQRLPPAAQGTLMMNPPYGERIAPKGQGAAPRSASREGFEDGADPAAFFAALAGALEAPLRRLDGLVPEPRDEAAVADAAEGEPARADVERRHRMPAVPLRHGGRVEPRPRPQRLRKAPSTLPRSPRLPMAPPCGS
jgi:putative N6-adenine-specific DNA methylase